MSDMVDRVAEAIEAAKDEWCKDAGEYNADIFPAEIAARAAMAALWQPIDTAPKDGTPVLLYYPEGIFDTAANDYVGAFFPDWAVMRMKENGFWEGYYSGTELDGPPTHWMPVWAPT